MFNFKTPQQVIGFDLGLEKLNMVQVSQINGHHKIKAALSDYHNSSYAELLAEPERMKALIKRSFNRMPFAGRTIVSTMPNSKLQLLFLNYQCKPEQKESDALLTALAGRINKDLREYVIDYVPIRPVMDENQSRIALVALVKKIDAENYLDLLKKCGLQVHALEIGPVAIRRLINSMSSESGSEKVLAINFGTQKSFLTVLWNGDILLDRPVNFGLESILQALSQSLDIDNRLALKLINDYGLSNKVMSVKYDLLDTPDDDDIKHIIHEVLSPAFTQLAAEVREVLLYIASETRGGAVERIYLLGSVARLRGLEQVIDKFISIPVTILNPFYGFAVDMSVSGLENLGPLSGIAVATGLALRGLN